MTSATRQDRTGWLSRRRMKLWLLMAVILLLPDAWKHGLSLAFLVSVAVYSLLDAAITLVRTRWFFRVSCEVANAAILATMFWTQAFRENGMGHIALSFGLVALIVTLALTTGPFEERRYPKEVLAFKTARADAGRWGWLLFRQIPRLSYGDQE